MDFDYAAYGSQLINQFLERFLVDNHADPSKHTLGIYSSRPYTRYLLPKGVIVPLDQADNYPHITIKIGS